MSNNYFPTLSPDLQVGFYYKLKNIKDLYLHESLKKTILTLPIQKIDSELNSYIPSSSLQKLASYSLRGEAIFPIPIVLIANPFLLGYYRLLYGFSQKEFYSKMPFGKFKQMEEKGGINLKIAELIPELCTSLSKTGVLLIDQLDEIELSTVRDLQLLTLGAQFRGSANNKFGQIATQQTFDIIRDLFKKYITKSTSSSLELTNDSGRKVSIKFSSDPDIEIIEKLPSSSRGLISIEIKGGKDYSNIHNRIGEAEKSHQKAKSKGYYEFMTIISVDIDYNVLKSESPTTSHFFNLTKISNNQTEEHAHFKEILSSIISVKI